MGALKQNHIKGAEFSDLRKSKGSGRGYTLTTYQSMPRPFQCEDDEDTNRLTFVDDHYVRHFVECLTFTFTFNLHHKPTR